MDDLEARVVALEKATARTPDDSRRSGGGGRATLPPPDEVAPLFAALGHPTRLAILWELVQKGTVSGQALSAAVGLQSAGQMHHHLGSLRAGGIIEQGQRGTYTVSEKHRALLRDLGATAAKLADLPRR